ncbi:MAG: preprotein translocase subunit SecY, partial [Akkermansia sp.]
MISAFANSMKVPELRQRILFTLAMIVVARLGVHIPLPGVNVAVLDSWMQAQQNDGSGMNALAAVLTIFSGGGLQQCGIFALGIMPYISASIMTQLLTAVVPKWQKMVREDGGRQKMTKWTRGIAIGIAIVQGWFLVVSLENPARLPFLQGIEQYGNLVMFPGFGFAFSTILIIVAGTMFLMWIGDQITEKGIGNGVSLIIGVNIIHSLPGALTIAWKTLVHPAPNEINPMGAFALVALIAFLMLVIALVVTVTQAQRRIAV